MKTLILCHWCTHAFINNFSYLFDKLGQSAASNQKLEMSTFLFTLIKNVPLVLILIPLQPPAEDTVLCASIMHPPAYLGEKANAQLFKNYGNWSWMNRFYIATDAKRQIRQRTNDLTSISHTNKNEHPDLTHTNWYISDTCKPVT